LNFVWLISSDFTGMRSRIVTCMPVSDNVRHWHMQLYLRRTDTSDIRCVPASNICTTRVKEVSHKKTFFSLLRHTFTLFGHFSDTFMGVKEVLKQRWLLMVMWKLNLIASFLAFQLSRGVGGEKLSYFV